MFDKHSPDITFFSGLGRRAPQDKQSNGNGEAHAGEHRNFLHIHRVPNRSTLSTDNPRRSTLTYVPATAARPRPSYRHTFATRLKRPPRDSPATRLTWTTGTEIRRGITSELSPFQRESQLGRLRERARRHDRFAGYGRSTSATVNRTKR